MPTRIETIILRARDTLADLTAERYSDARLLRLLSEGQEDIVKQTRLLRNTYNLIPIPDKVVYDLPSDAWFLTRASYKGEKISLVTFDEMDNYLPSTTPTSYDFGYDSNYGNNYWQTRTGARPEALVYDRLNMQKIQVYPIISEDSLENTFTFTGGNLSFYGGFEFGVVTDITGYSFSSVFGVVTDFFDPFNVDTFSSVFGVVTQISQVDTEIVIQYFSLPSAVTSINDTLVISPLLDTALKHYIVSQAYLDDLDTQSQTSGKLAFGLYERELKVGKATGSNNNTINSARTTPYVGPF